MAIISLDQLVESTGGTITPTKRDYKQVFRAVSNSPQDGSMVCAVALRTQKGVYVGAQYHTDNETDIAAWCQSVNPERQGIIKDGGNTYYDWRITVSYSTSEKTQYDSPLDEPTKRRWSTEAREVECEYDIYGAPILNTAKDKFSWTQITKDDPRATLTFERNEAVSLARAQWCYQYRNALNAQTFYGGAKNTVKVVGITRDLEYDTRCGFYEKCSYSFCYDPNGWQKVLLNAGTRQLIKFPAFGGQPAHADIVPIYKKQIPVSEPVLLKSNGLPLPMDDQGNYTAAPVWLYFDVYPSLPFGVFGL